VISRQSSFACGNKLAKARRLAENGMVINETRRLESPRFGP
jgi:hypothetical protein